MKAIILTIELSVNRKKVRLCQEISYTNELSHSCGLKESLKSLIPDRK